MNDAEKKWCNVKLSLILYGKLCAFRVQRYENFCDFSGSQLEDKFSTPIKNNFPMGQWERFGISDKR